MWIVLCSLPTLRSSNSSCICCEIWRISQTGLEGWSKVSSFSCDLNYQGGGVESWVRVMRSKIMIKLFNKEIHLTRLLPEYIIHRWWGVIYIFLFYSIYPIYPIWFNKLNLFKWNYKYQVLIIIYSGVICYGLILIFYLDDSSLYTVVSSVLDAPSQHGEIQCGKFH